MQFFPLHRIQLQQERPRIVGSIALRFFCLCFLLFQSPRSHTNPLFSYQSPTQTLYDWSFSSGGGLSLGKIPNPYPLFSLKAQLTKTSQLSFSSDLELLSSQILFTTPSPSLGFWNFGGGLSLGSGSSLSFEGSVEFLFSEIFPNFELGFGLLGGIFSFHRGSFEPRGLSEISKAQLKYTNLLLRPRIWIDQGIWIEPRLIYNALLIGARHDTLFKLETVFGANF